jgi:Flp pilus assembly pilin Flp
MPAYSNRRGINFPNWDIVQKTTSGTELFRAGEMALARFSRVVLSQQQRSVSQEYPRMSIKSRVRQLGQGMTEYIIIVALIAISAIVVYNLFGSTVREQVGDMAAELGGGDAKQTAAATGLEAQSKSEIKSNLSNFKQEERK